MDTRLTVSCQYCYSQILPSESSLCCFHGQCLIPIEMFGLFGFDPDEEYSVLFSQIPVMMSVQLNNLLAFASIGTDRVDRTYHRDDREIYEAHGIIFRIAHVSMLGLNGRVYHRPRNWRGFGPLPVMPVEFEATGQEEPGSEDRTPDDIALRYVYERMLDYFSRCNCLSQLFTRAVENTSVTRIRLIEHSGEGARPHAREPYVLVGSDDLDNNIIVPPGFDPNDEFSSRVSFVVWDRQTQQNLALPSQLIEPASYPLLFPRGHGGINLRDQPVFLNSHRKMSIHDYVKYVIYQRLGVCVRVPHLFQLWMLDMFSRWQELRFAFMAKQRSVVASMHARVARYIDVDLEARRRGDRVGRPFVLPASVVGSAAHRAENMKDGAAICAKRGRPTFFITMTCNPKWQEVLTFCREAGVDVGPDFSEDAFAVVVCRIWREKRRMFIQSVREGTLFDVPVQRASWLQAVDEFQKRFWPHIHCLARILRGDDRDSSWSALDLDRVVCARLFMYELCPVYAENARDMDADALCALRERVKENRENCDCVAHVTYELVKKLMVHQCRVGYCKKHANDFCSKNFPKRCGTQVSAVDAKGFWHLRRPLREDAFVVPYSPAAIRRFKCHINVEPTTAIHTIRYLNSYMNKGPDWTTLSAQDVLRDVKQEFLAFQRVRHVGLAEVFYRFTDIHTITMEPAVTRLRVHLPGEHTVLLREGDDTADQSCSSLLRYFWRHRELAAVKYEEYFENFILGSVPPCGDNVPYWPDSPDCGFRVEVKYAKRRSGDHVARLDSPHHSSVERYCLALLLRQFAAFSFEELLQGHDTYAQAAYAAGLYCQLDEYDACFTEMICPGGGELQHGYTHETPFSLRMTFVAMLIAGADGSMLLGKFAHWMGLDLPHGVLASTTVIPDEVRMQLLLQELADMLSKERRSLSDFGLPEPTTAVGETDMAIVRELARYDKEQLEKEADCVRFLNSEQRAVYDAVLHPGNEDLPETRLIYVEAFAGCGKSYVSATIIAALRLAGSVVCVCAPSARAAQLYSGGQTAHALFDLPVKPCGVPIVSTMTYGCAKARLLCAAQLIVIDEAPMLNRFCFAAIDSCLRDVRSDPRPFGGATVLALGNFAQLGPVVKDGDIVEASIINGDLFKLFRLFELTTPQRDASDPEYSRFVRSLAVGKGEFRSPLRLPEPVGIFRPGDLTAFSSLRLQINALRRGSQPHQQLTGRNSAALYRSTVCAATNELVDRHNRFISGAVAEVLRQPIKSIKSINEMLDELGDADGIGSIDLMENYEDSGQLPPHDLPLFPGCLVQLTRNFLVSRGLTNGKACRVVHVGRHVLRLSPLDEDDNCFTLFRFIFKVELPHLFSFQRRQYPLKVSFAQTIHRLQSCTIKVPSVLIFDMTVPPFTHALTYVAMSRICTSSQLNIITDDDETFNDRTVPVHVCWDLIASFQYAQLNEEEFDDEF